MSDEPGTSASMGLTSGSRGEGLGGGGVDKLLLRGRHSGGKSKRQAKRFAKQNAAKRGRPAKKMIEFESDSDDLENAAFKEMSDILNHSKKIVGAPPQLTPAKCLGIGDPLEMWNNMVRRDELLRPSASILEKHPVLTEHTRVILLDWIKEVCETECLHRETYHLTIDYIDRFLSNVDTSRFQVNMDNFQLIGTTALFMASKYEEIYPPKCNDLANYTDEACSAQNIIDMELKMLEVLQWSLTPMTSLHWLKIFLQLMGDRQLASALIGDRHLAEKLAVVPDFMREDYIHMAKILDLLLLEVQSLRYSYRQLAAGVIYNCYEPQSLVQQVTGISGKQLLEVSEWVKPVVELCDRRRPLGDPLPSFHGIRSSEVHDIQTHDKSPHIDHTMREIQTEREARERAAAASYMQVSSFRRSSALRTLSFSSNGNNANFLLEPHLQTMRHQTPFNHHQQMMTPIFDQGTTPALHPFTTLNPFF